MKKLKLSIALLCSGVSFLVSCSSGDATFNIKSKNHSKNDVIGIYSLSNEMITARNLDSKSLTFTSYVEKKGYVRLVINSDKRTEFWMFLDNASYEIETDAEDNSVYPIKSSSSKIEQEIIEYYKIKARLQKEKGDDADPFSTVQNLNAIEEYARTYPNLGHTLFFLEQENEAANHHDIYQSILNLLDPAIRETKAGKKLQEQILVGKSMELNTSLQEISGENLQGKAFNPRVLKDLNVFICWATYDPNSRKNNIKLLPIYEKYKSKGVEFIGISYDKNEDWWRTVIKDDKLVWPQYNDFLGAKSPNAYLSNHRVPYIFITNRYGEILSNKIEISSLDLEIDELLQKPN